MTELIMNLTAVDYIFLSIALVALAYGWARGFVELLTGFVVFIVATLIAGRYSATVVSWLNRTWSAEDRFIGLLERRLNLPPEASKAPVSSIPWERVFELLQDLPLPGPYKQALAERVAEWTTNTGTMTLATYIFKQIAAMLLNGLVFMVLAALIGWGLTFLARLVSDQVRELPLVGTANRGLGATIMLVQAALAIAFFVGMVAPLLTVYGFPSVGTAVQRSELAPQFLRLLEWAKNLLFGDNPAFFFFR